MSPSASPEHDSFLRRSIQAQLSRGPDHQALTAIELPGMFLGLAHVRLSIIDLSVESHQPMWNAERSVCIVFNGEIYNYVELRDELAGMGYQFRTRSDTEVILVSYQAWGLRALERFNGMFAFAIYDARSRSLLLARDRFGVKPLYVANDGHTLHFASTPACIAEATGHSRNEVYAALGLRYGIFDADTLGPYHGIVSVPGGSYITAKLDHGKIVCQTGRYYELGERSMRQADDLASLSVKQMKSRLEELLVSSVSLRLRADVPLAVSLSGGLDSSTVAALASESGSGSLTGFTIGSPDDRRTEGPIVQRFGQLKGMRTIFVAPESRDVSEALVPTLRAQQAPFSSCSVIAQYLLYREVKSRGIKVLLGGQGGDESFMGYHKFLVFHLQELWRAGRWREAVPHAGYCLLMALEELKRFGTYWRQRHRFSRQGRESVLSLPEVSLQLGLAENKSLRDRQQEDILRLSLPTLLRYEDRNSMAHSVESRLPFVDYRLVEFGLSLPVAAKLHRGLGKWIVREVMQQRLPEEIRSPRSKRGFDVHQSAWIRGGLGQALRDALEQCGATVGNWLSPKHRIAEIFSDEQLCTRPGAFAEAVSLLWLSGKEA